MFVLATSVLTQLCPSVCDVVVVAFAWTVVEACAHKLVLYFTVLQIVRVTYKRTG